MELPNFGRVFLRFRERSGVQLERFCPGGKVGPVVAVLAHRVQSIGVEGALAQSRH